MPTSSSQSLSLLRSRHPETIEQLVRAHTAQLYRTARTMRFEKSAARELVQAVWMTFLEVCPRFQGHSSVKTFLFGIFYNKAAELRREQTHVDSFDEIESIVESRFNSEGSWQSHPADPERFLLASETLQLIEDCMDALPISQRMAFCLRTVEEQETRDICDMMGVTTNYLGVLLYRAKNSLRECVEAKS